MKALSTEIVDHSHSSEKSCQGKKIAKIGDYRVEKCNVANLKLVVIIY